MGRPPFFAVSKKKLIVNCIILFLLFTYLYQLMYMFNYFVSSSIYFTMIFTRKEYYHILLLQLI